MIVVLTTIIRIALITHTRTQGALRSVQINRGRITNVVGVVGAANTSVKCTSKLQLEQLSRQEVVMLEVSAIIREERLAVERLLQ